MSNFRSSILHNRRQLLVRAAGAIALVQAPVVLAARKAQNYTGFWLQPRELWIERKETGEAGRFEYWRDGQLNLPAWFGILHMLRDVKSNLALHYDPAAINIVWGCQQWLFQDQGKRPKYLCTDGARSEETNANTPGAAPGSTHKNGQATDGSMVGYALSDFARAAWFFKAGGVGLYPGHVHTDSGRTRRWGRAF